MLIAWGFTADGEHVLLAVMLFNVLAMVAEFEADLIRLRTREGMRVAKAKGRLRPGAV